MQCAEIVLPRRSLSFRGITPHLDLESGEFIVDKTPRIETEIRPPKKSESRVIVLTPQERAILINLPRRIHAPRAFSTMTVK